jgi:hypothetical protein
LAENKYPAHLHWPWPAISTCRLRKWKRRWKSNGVEVVLATLALPPQHRVAYLARAPEKRVAFLDRLIASDG